MINICFVVCILLFAPQVYIELPLGSSKRELHFWTLEYCLLTYSGAMITNFRNLKSIVALLFAFQYLLPSYILSSLWGAPGGSSIFGHWDFGSLHIQEQWQQISEVYDQYLLCMGKIGACKVVFQQLSPKGHFGDFKDCS